MKTQHRQANSRQAIGAGIMNMILDNVVGFILRNGLSFYRVIGADIDDNALLHETLKIRRNSGKARSIEAPEGNLTE